MPAGKNGDQQGGNHCYADSRLERETNKSFPGHHSLTRLGTLNERIELVRQYATEHSEFSDVLEILPKYADGYNEREVLHPDPSRVAA